MWGHSKVWSVALCCKLSIFVRWIESPAAPLVLIRTVASIMNFNDHRRVAALETKALLNDLLWKLHKNENSSKWARRTAACNNGNEIDGWNASESHWFIDINGTIETIETKGNVIFYWTSLRFWYLTATILHSFDVRPVGIFNQRQRSDT